MISEIKKGMTLKCLNCGKPVELTKDTMVLDFDAEYIKCPSCQARIDVQKYHIFGEIAEKKESEE